MINHKFILLHKSKGFTIIELMFGLIIFALIVLSVVKAKEGVYSRDVNTSIATQTQLFEKIATNYIQNNYLQIQKQITNNPIYINVAQLSAAGYFPTGMITKNILGQVPCIYIANRNNHLEPLLFFVNTSSTGIYKPQTITNAAELIAILGSTAGYIDASGDAVSMGNTWKISNAISLLNPAQCNGASIARYSLVVNLALTSNFNTNTDSDQSVYRGNDAGAVAGESENFNTLQTDVTLHQVAINGFVESYHALVIGNNIQIRGSSTDNNAVATSNGGLVVNNIIPSASNDNLYNSQITLQTGTACTMNQMGAMGSQTMQETSGRLISNQLQCVFNALLCQGSDPQGNPRNGYCFLPQANTKLALVPNVPDISCPQGYFISGTASVDVSCQCQSGSPSSGNYIQYDGVVAYGIQVNRGAHGRCNCSSGGQGLANITNITCSNSNPALTYNVN